MEILVEFCPIGKPHNQSKNSDSNSGGPIFLKKFRTTAQSYVSSLESNSSDTSSPSSEDYTYEPLSNSSSIPVNIILSSDVFFWNRITAEDYSQIYFSLPYTSISFHVDFIKNISSKN
jgi:hypothetical protein